MFRRLIPIEEARRLIEENYTPKPVGSETVPISAAYGRVLAEDIVSKIDVPPFSRSTVDGYAVRASDTFGADETKPISLKVVGWVCVGEMPSVVVTEGTAVKISTGAPIPKGANAVVMLEYAIQKGDVVQIYDSVAPSNNILVAGFDVKSGEKVLVRGQQLIPRELGVMAAIGASSVRVYRKPKVAILSTGNEIVEPGKPLDPGKIYDINASTLSASVVENGGEPLFLGIVGDDVNMMRRVIKHGLEATDLVLTSGATSVGPEDFLPMVLNELGKPGVLACGLSIRPGKPTTIAIVDGKPVFSLPGHPASALTVFNLLVRPLVRGLAGLPVEPEGAVVEGWTTKKMFPAKGRLTFMPVRLERDPNGKFLVHPIQPESGAITTLAEADGFVKIPIERQFIDEGERVVVHLFRRLS